jgi:hypothetical protein
MTPTAPPPDAPPPDAPSPEPNPGRADAAADARAERFLADLGDVRPELQSSNRRWGKVGVGLLVLGPILTLLALLLSQGTDNPLDQSTDVSLGLVGVAVTLAGLGLYLRHSFVEFLRFWLARFIYEQRRERHDETETETGCR